MPAVDYRLPGGLSWKELTTVLKAAAASGKLLGIAASLNEGQFGRYSS